MGQHSIELFSGRLAGDRSDGMGKGRASREDSTVKFGAAGVRESPSS